MSGLSGSVGLTVFLFTILLWPAMIDTDNRVDAISKQVAMNNVPEIKQNIKLILEKIDSLEDSTSRIEGQLNLLIDNNKE